MRRARVAVVASGLAAVASASGSVVDLTGGPGSSGFINGAFYEFDNQQPAGTGVLDPFVRIQANNFEEGYNTSSNSLPFDEMGGPWTHDIQLSDAPIVALGGINYLHFVLDINEPASPAGRLLSLDALMILTSTIPSQNTTNVLSLGTLRYDMDAGEDSWVLMDYTNASGSGETDMSAYIPANLFAGASPGDYLYLYSAFGANEESGDGFEEWAVVVPGPTSLAVLGGLLALGRRRRPR